jgi:ribonuclease HI
MNVSMPQFVLYLESSRTPDSGQWRFSLQTPDGLEQLAADDIEPETRGERLDLLTVVRALEALDQPSKVTLIGCSRYVRNGLQYGLPEWRNNGWRWEFFGQMLPVKNGDLWQRVDRALRFHQVECRQGARPEPRPECLVESRRQRSTVYQGEAKPECRTRRFDTPHAKLAGRHKDKPQASPTEFPPLGTPGVKSARST